MTLYHGTSSTQLLLIQKKGLVQPYLTSSQSIAQYYAEEAVAESGGQPIILIVEVTDTSKLRYDGPSMEEVVERDGFNELTRNHQWNKAAQEHPEWMAGGYINIPASGWQYSLRGAGGVLLDDTVPFQNIKQLKEAQDEDDELSDLQREMRTIDPANVKKFLDDNLVWMLGMWVIVDYSDFTGTSLDRANAAYFLKKYPGIVSRNEHQRFNNVIVGIRQEDLGNLSGDALHFLSLDLQTLENEGVLDTELYKKIQNEKITEAWVNWVSKNFRYDLCTRVDEPKRQQIINLPEARLWALFDEARGNCGQEWTEQDGADQTIDVEKVANCVDEEILSRWLGGQIQAENTSNDVLAILGRLSENLPEKQARLSLELTCGSSTVHADEWDGSTTNHPRHELVKELAEQAGLACDLSGTIDHGEHFSDAYLRLGPADLQKAVQILKQAGWEGDILDIYEQGTLDDSDIKKIAAFARRQGWQLGNGFETVHESLLEDRQYSCLMAPAPPELTDAVIRWGQMFVQDDELYADPQDPDGYGREDEIHVTVKFGLHDAEPSKELLRIIEETQPFEIEIGPCTLFENEKYDVVKFDVDGDGLRELNRRVSELPNSDEHPEYHPHMTVAYVLKGTCHELIGKPLLDPQTEPDLRFVVKTVIFSSLNKTKTTLFLGKPNLEEAKQRTDWLSRLMSQVDFNAENGWIDDPDSNYSLEWEWWGSDCIFDAMRRGLLGPEVDYKTLSNDEKEVIFLRELKRRLPALSKGKKPVKIWWEFREGGPVDYDAIGFILWQRKFMGEAERQSNMPAVTNKALSKPGRDRPGTVAKPTLSNVDKLPAHKLYRVVPADAPNPFLGQKFGLGKFFMSPDNRFVELADHEPSAAAIAGEKKDPNDSWLDRFSARLHDAGWVRILFDRPYVQFSWRINKYQLKRLREICVKNRYTLIDDCGRWPKEIYVPPPLPENPVTGEIIKEDDAPRPDDEEMDLQMAKDVYGPAIETAKKFTDTDVTGGTFPRIFADRSELVDAPTPWQKAGLQQTASGYGAKLTTSYKIMFNGKLYRLYSTCYGNAGSVWFIAKGLKIFVG